MGTVTQDKSTVSISVQTASVIFVSNALFRWSMGLAQARGISNDYLLKDRESLARMMFTYLSTQDLHELHLNVFAGGKQLEQWIARFDYHDSSSIDLDRPKAGANLDQCLAFAKKLSKLPAGTTVEVQVVVAAGAPPVEGWVSTPYKGSGRKGASSFKRVIETPLIDASIEYTRGD